MLLKQTATLTRLARTYSLNTPSTRLSLTASRAYASTSTPHRSQAQAFEESHHHEARQQQQQQQQQPTSSPGTSGSPVGASGVRVPYYTLAELESMTLQDLRALCKENGLKVGGRKKELVDRTHKYVHDHHHQPHATKEASKSTVQEANSTERAHIKDQLEWEARLQKEQAAQMKQLEKEAQANEKREMEKRAREAQEKEAAALAKREKHERELRLKEQQEKEARKQEQYEKELRLKHEKEARLRKEKHEQELRLKEQQEKEARLMKEQHEKEARLAKEKHEHELRVKEQHEKEARLKKEQHEKEARLAKEKHEHELRLKEAHEKEAHMKKEMEAKEALVKKEQHQKQLLLKAEEERRKEQLAAAAKRIQAQAVDHEHQNGILSAKEGSSSHRSDSNEWAKEKLPLGTRAAGLAMGLGIMAWFLSGKRDRWAEAQEQAKAQEQARLHGEKLKE
ncbi:hypothetical protein CPB97_009203 [Podila verticillata]|nr:hypothetical protein CPB97_009203 [Podila verticillata]